MNDKLLETENEAMSKIVELEKQLMQKNKELDTVRVSFTPPDFDFKYVYLYRDINKKAKVTALKNFLKLHL